jgi:hypothetical protein
MLRKTAWTSISVGHETAVSHPVGVTSLYTTSKMHIGERGVWDSPLIFSFGGERITLHIAPEL